LLDGQVVRPKYTLELRLGHQQTLHTIESTSKVVVLKLTLELGTAHQQTIHTAETLHRTIIGNTTKSQYC
jgi:hypothetical protein